MSFAFIGRFVHQVSSLLCSRSHQIIGPKVDVRLILCYGYGGICCDGSRSVVFEKKLKKKKKKQPSMIRGSPAISSLTWRHHLRMAASKSAHACGPLL
ncbi:hypothetical protein L249_6912 [Ophiocordyceps polyrhachis-furcata BCC 54312]|uniref:Uncharacterized protein n=1 Tax=Ophiocordyceps polyrhachis-furcata BCC 54312 TaxID=1330021 RepID=A0A367LK52_9HYPO|nr:hypothetical protein L249_6912 [Ophiocordyceps polyrhachis-furcata BCC 54312]